MRPSRQRQGGTAVDVDSRCNPEGVGSGNQQRWSVRRAPGLTRRAEEGFTEHSLPVFRWRWEPIGMLQPIGVLVWRDPQAKPALSSPLSDLCPLVLLWPRDLLAELPRRAQ